MISAIPGGVMGPFDLFFLRFFSFAGKEGAEGLQGDFRHVVLDSLCILLGWFSRHTHGAQQVHHQAVAWLTPSRRAMSVGRASPPVASRSAISSA